MLKPQVQSHCESILTLLEAKTSLSRALGMVAFWKVDQIGDSRVACMNMFIKSSKHHVDQWRMVIRTRKRQMEVQETTGANVLKVAV